MYHILVWIQDCIMFCYLCLIFFILDVGMRCSVQQRNTKKYDKGFYGVNFDEFCSSEEKGLLSDLLSRQRISFERFSESWDSSESDVGNIRQVFRTKFHSKNFNFFNCLDQFSGAVVAYRCTILLCYLDWEIWLINTEIQISAKQRSSSWATRKGRCRLII